MASLSEGPVTVPASDEATPTRAKGIIEHLKRQTQEAEARLEKAKVYFEEDPFLSVYEVKKAIIRQGLGSPADAALRKVRAQVCKAKGIALSPRDRPIDPKTGVEAYPHKLDGKALYRPSFRAPKGRGTRRRGKTLFRSPKIPAVRGVHDIESAVELLLEQMKAGNVSRVEVDADGHTKLFTYATSEVHIGVRE